jgi:large subunit ribosomal protein L13
VAAETRVATRTGEAQHVQRIPSTPHFRIFTLMSTYTARPTDIEHKWFLVDADGMVLGRLATEVARILRGKHKPTFTPHMDTGDFVIIINAAKVRVTGRKAEQKTYFTHSGFMGHDKKTPFATMLAKHPERVIEHAVHGMLPKNALGRQKLRLKLRVYPGAEHPHVAQQPKALTFKKSEAK